MEGKELLAGKNNNQMESSNERLALAREVLAMLSNQLNAPSPTNVRKISFIEGN